MTFPNILFAAMFLNKILQNRIGDIQTFIIPLQGGVNFQKHRKVIGCKRPCYCARAWRLCDRQQPTQVEGNNMLPPHVMISFNPLMNQQDGLLALEISRTKAISYRKATELINNKVREFRNKLHIGKSLEFGRIGTFTMDENRNLIFNPSFCPPFIPFNLGLQKLPLPKQEKHHSKEIVIRITRDQVMKYVAVLLAVFSLLLPPKVNKTTDVVQADFSKLVLVNLPEITIEPDADADISFNEQAHPDNQSQIKASHTYKIIVAAFYTKEKAQMVCNDLIKRNYPAEMYPETTSTQYPSGHLMISVLPLVSWKTSACTAMNFQMPGL